MATVFANYGINYGTVDMNLLVRAQTDSALLDNVNYSYNGHVYQDVARFQYVSNVTVDAAFGGYDITADANGYVTGGTITVFLESVWNGNAWVPGWGVQSISYPAVSISQAALTVNTSDDLVVLADMLQGNDYMSLSNSSDVMRGFNGSDRMSGNGGNDVLLGDEGHDFLIGGSGNDYLDGGAGVDTAEFMGFMNQYLMQGNSVVDKLSGRDGTDTLSGVERLEFADGNLALDVAYGETAGIAYRLYNAAFDRSPDEGGLGHWISRLDQGANLVEDVAQSFINSQEFQNSYGANISDNAFVTLLYNNVLDRNPDQSGLNYWNAQMSQGMSQAEVLVNFSESAENVANVADLIAHGIKYQDWLG